MLDDHRILALIPARGGSKGLPGKNLLEIAGRPLLDFTFTAATRSAYIDRIILSSEDPQIIDTARRLGIEVPFVRPSELAEDQVSGDAVVAHAIAACPGYDYIVLLQPTSPLRSTSDIDGSIETCIHNGCASCVTVTAVKKSPFWMYTLGADQRMTPFADSRWRRQNRQAHPALYLPNGAVYVARNRFFLRNRSFYGEDTVAYVMPPERSVDIDDRLDFLLAKTLLEAQTEQSER